MNDVKIKVYKDKNKVPISVIMPVYNAERYLRIALNSIIEQVFKDFELICVDDGSTDKSLEMLNKYADKDQRVRVITQKNLHVGAARNNGLSLAKGKYVIFLDSDDIFAPDLLQLLYEKVESTQADICLCGANMFDSSSGKIMGTIGINLEPSLASREVFSWRDSQQEFFRCTCPAPWNKIYRKDFLDRTGIRFPDYHTAEDLYFYACTLVAADRISCVKKKLVYYRCNNSDSLDVNAYKSPYDFLKSLLGIRKWLLDHSLLDLLKDDYEKMAAAHCVRNLKIFMQIMAKEEFDKLLTEVNAHEQELGNSFVYN